MSQNISSIRVVVPDTIQGAVLQQLNKVGGVIKGVDHRPNNQTGIDATLPAESLRDFKIWLQSYAGNQGVVSETDK